MIKAKRMRETLRSPVHADDAVTQWNICSIVVCQPFTIIIKESKESFIDSVWAYIITTTQHTEVTQLMHNSQRTFWLMCINIEGFMSALYGRWWRRTRLLCYTRGLGHISLAVCIVCSPCELEIHILMCVTNFMMHFPFDGENWIYCCLL